MTTTTDDGRRSGMVAALTERGALTDPAWVDAFASVPRELFVPRYFLPRRDAPGWRLVEGDDEWRDGVYTDDALVTQMCGDETAADTARRGQRLEGSPTSSSSAPTLMARMLHALHVEPRRPRPRDRHRHRLQHGAALTPPRV